MNVYGYMGEWMDDFGLSLLEENGSICGPLDQPMIGNQKKKKKTSQDCIS